MFAVVYEGDSGLETFGPFNSFNEAKNFMSKDSAKQLEYFNKNEVYPVSLNETEHSIEIIPDNLASTYKWTITELVKC